MSENIFNKVINKYFGQSDQIPYIGNNNFIYSQISKINKKIIPLENLNNLTNEQIILVSFNEISEKNLLNEINKLHKKNIKKFLINTKKNFNFSEFIKEMNWLSIDIYNKRNQNDYYFFLILR